MFSPYHRLNNCTRLQRTVAALRDGGHVTDAVFAGHNKYHYSLLHKLNSAKVHLESLEDLLKSTDATTAITSNDFLGKANMYLDSFFYCSGSALDILAREVLVYFSIAFPGNVYYSTARNEINTHRPGDTLLPRLVDPTWKAEFSNYRNALTHEVLIGINYQINVTQDGARSVRKIVFPLPDDPRNPNSGYTSNPDSVEYCRTTFHRLLSLINTIYGDIETRARTSNSLPL